MCCMIFYVVDAGERSHDLVQKSGVKGFKRHSCDSLKSSVDEFGKGIRRLRWTEFNNGLSEYGGWKQEAIEKLNCMGHSMRRNSCPC